ncbi:hypothetical protein Z950_2110 [Sulfitobacter mediterraneus KCTC 32188]|nr:hypothetical protein Z950_2110 [Sulfitobacter mediterraneus KCTC 32188]
MRGSMFHLAKKTQFRTRCSHSNKDHSPPFHLQMHGYNYAP